MSGGSTSDSFVNLKSVEQKIRKYYFTGGVVDAWEKCPAEVVGKLTVNEGNPAWDIHVSILR